MFKSCVVPFLVFTATFFFKYQSAKALDPYLIIEALGAASSMVQTSEDQSNKSAIDQFSDYLGEGASILEEGSEISEEFNSDLESAQLAEKAEKLQQLNSKMKNIKSTSEDLKMNLDADINSTKKLSQKMRQAKNIIKASKKLASLFGLKTKGSEKVATLQQVKINSMMLDELQNMNRMQLLTYLDTKEKTLNRELYLNKIMLEDSHQYQKNTRISNSMGKF